MAAASASAAQLGVVAESGSNQVSMVSLATSKVIGTPVAVGKKPVSVAITPDGRHAYVTNEAGKSVSVIETGLRRIVATVELGKEPFGIAITPDGKYAYVTDFADEEVSVISTQTNAVVKSIPVGDGPTGIAISPTGKFAYVADHAQNVVEVINTETMAVSGPPIEVGEDPKGIEFTPAGTAYVVDQGGEEVSAIDPLTRKVTGIELETAQPRAISISPDGAKAYVVGTGPISVINTGTNKVTDEIEVAGDPQEVAFAANGKTVYVSESETHQVQTINVETGKVSARRSRFPAIPTGIALTPDQSPVAAFTRRAPRSASPRPSTARPRPTPTARSPRTLGPSKTGATRPGSAPSTPSSPPAPSTRNWPS